MKLIIAAAIALWQTASTAAVEQPETVVITIDTEQRHQVIEGFGASGAWWPRWVRDYPREEQLQMLRMLFTDQGAGLNIYRYNIPAGAPDTVIQRERRTPDIETAPGRFDFDADADGIGFLKDVRELGVERFVLFANSPPARLTVNGQTSGGPEGGSNLKPDAADDFARYLVDVAEHLKTELDLPHVTISPINEPQWEWGKDWRGQEGCHYTPAEAAVAVRAVVDEVRRRGVDMHVEAPESGAWEGSDKYAKALFDDPVIDEALDTFAVHSYWSDAEKKHRFTAWFNEHYPDKTLSMTEFCQMKGIHNPGMDGGLHLANVMHDDLTIGSVITWQWWLAIAAGGYADGLIYASPKEHKIEPTKRLWVMGHYARFIKPGYQRVEAGCDDGDVRASAYVSPDGNTAVLVLINNSDDVKHLKAHVSSLDASAPRQYWLTDKATDLAQQDINTGPVPLPAHAIATVIFKQQE